MNLKSPDLVRAAAAVEQPAAHYDTVSIVLHWTTAVLVIALWLIAQFIDDFARGTPRIMARSTHIALGVALALVICTRIAWRASSGRRLPLAVPGLLGNVARAVHYGLYALIAVTIALGIFNVWTRGDSIFGLFSVPKLAPGNAGLKETMEELHEWFANAVLIVAGLHAAAALFHRYILRDEVLRRMLPERNQRS
jgi:cytochrome b561